METFKLDKLNLKELNQSEMLEIEGGMALWKTIGMIATAVLMAMAYIYEN